MFAPSRFKLLLLAIAVAAPLLAAKCGDDGPKEISVDVTEENFCDEMAEVMCNNVFKCCTGEQIEAVFGIKLTTSEQECRRDMGLYCRESTSALQHSLSSGRVRMNDNLVKRCLESYMVEDDECFPVVSEFALPCQEEMIEGQQRPGQPCLFDHDCINDTYCANNRTCVSYPKAGESCEIDGICADGLFCGYTDDALELICQMRKDVGMECDYSLECKENLFCHEADEDSATTVRLDMCEAKKSVDEPCDTDEMCLTRFCLPGTCSTDARPCYGNEECAGICEESRTTCQTDDDCGRGECEDGSSCTDSADCDEGPCVMRAAKGPALASAPRCARRITMRSITVTGVLSTSSPPPRTATADPASSPVAWAGVSPFTGCVTVRTIVPMGQTRARPFAVSLDAMPMNSPATTATAFLYMIFVTVSSTARTSTVITNVPVEVAFAIPLYLALVIAFTKYWEMGLGGQR